MFLQAIIAVPGVRGHHSTLKLCVLYSALPSAAAAGAAGAPHKQQLPDECKLYVGNLPPAYDSAMLRQLFEPHARVVHSAVITEPGSGNSRGFGFIHIPDPAQVGLVLLLLLLLRQLASTTHACAGLGCCVWHQWLQGVQRTGFNSEE